MASRRVAGAQRASTSATRRTSSARASAFFPLRDVPRHGDELRGRERDHRARLRLVLHGRRHRGRGWLGPRYTDEADPGTTSFVPRPDWFFYFLFYLLRIFKWPETVVIGTVGIPTILLDPAVRAAVPRPSAASGVRSAGPSRSSRPSSSSISMGVLTYKGATAKEALGSEPIVLVPEWAEDPGFRRQPDAVAGPTLFASPAASTATPTSARAPRTSARRTSPRSARPAAARAFFKLRRQPASSATTSMPPFAHARRQPHDREVPQLGEFLDGLEGRRRRRYDVKVFLGITGASGAPYAAGCSRRSPRRMRGRPRGVDRRHRGARHRALRRCDACRATKCSSGSSAAATA